MDDPESAPRFALEAMGYGASPVKTTTPGRSGDAETQGKQYNAHGKS